MSRTTKDRPYWVRANDPSESRNADHNHVHLGEPHYINRPVLDEFGDRIYDTVPQFVLAEEFKSSDYGFGFYTSYYLRNKTDAEREKILRLARLALSAGKPKTPIHVGYSGVLRTVRELAYVIPDHCTIDEPHDDKFGYSRSGYSPQPCSYNLAHHVYSYYYNRPMVDEKRQYHATQRSRERAPLRAAVKYYNSGEDLDGYDHADLHGREHRHNGWWD